MVNRPDSSSTRSDKSSSSPVKSMNKVKSNGRSITTFVRSKSGNDYVTNNRTLSSSTMQSNGSKSGDSLYNKGMLRKFKSNGR